MLFRLVLFFVFGSLFQRTSASGSSENGAEVFKAILEKDGAPDTKGHFSLVKKFDDQADPSGLRRFPLQVAIQSGDYHYAFDYFLLRLYNSTEVKGEELIKVLLAEDALGWSSLEYAAAYLPRLLPALFSALSSSKSVPKKVVNNLVRIAFHDSTKTSSILSSVASSKAVLFFKRDLYQDLPLFEANLQEYLERKQENIIEFLNCFINENECGMLRVALLVVHEKKWAITEEVILSWLKKAFSEGRQDCFFLLCDYYHAYLLKLLKEIQIGSNQSSLSRMVMVAVILERIPDLEARMSGSLEQGRDLEARMSGALEQGRDLEARMSGSLEQGRGLETRTLEQSRDLESRRQGASQDPFIVSPQTRLVYRAIFEKDMNSLKLVANEFVSQGITVFDVAFAYRRQISLPEIRTLSSTTDDQALRDMILRVLQNSKASDLCGSKARQISVLKRVLAIVTDPKPVEFFAHFAACADGFLDEIKALAALIIDESQADADHLFAIFLANRGNVREVIEVFRFLCRLSRSATWISQENYMKLLQIMTEYDRLDVGKMVEFLQNETEMIEFLHEAYWNSDWPITEEFKATLEAFVSRFPVAELQVLLRVRKEPLTK